MSEGFDNQDWTSSNGGGQNGAADGGNATQDSGWISNTASAQENAGVQGTEFMNTYAGQAAGAASDMAQKPVKIVPGIVGAFLGVLIGVVLWVIIYQMGYIAGIAGFVMMICAFRGFELLGGRINIPGSVICILMVLAAVYFAHNIAMAISIMQEMKWGFSIAYQSIPAFREMSKEFATAYRHDLIMGYVITLVAIVPSIFSAIRGRR